MSKVASTLPSSDQRIKDRRRSHQPASSVVSAAPNRDVSSRGPTARIPQKSTSFNDVRDAGAYVAREHGFLVRITREALIPGAFLGVSITSLKPVILLKLSSDPWVPLATARRLAAEADTVVAF